MRNADSFFWSCLYLVYSVTETAIVFGLGLGFQRFCCWSKKIHRIESYWFWIYQRGNRMRWSTWYRYIGRTMSSSNSREEHPSIYREWWNHRTYVDKLNSRCWQVCEQWGTSLSQGTRTSLCLLPVDQDETLIGFNLLFEDGHLYFLSCFYCCLSSQDVGSLNWRWQWLISSSQLVQYTEDRFGRCSCCCCNNDDVCCQ